jgi:hypothetical protein
VFFEPLRQTRREKRAPPGTRQRCAVITMVRDERLLFPIWLRYYSRYFAPEDIYVLDHGSTDGSTEVGGFVRIPVERETVDVQWRLDTIEAEQRRLLARYDVVLTVDVDEIVAPDPEWGPLDDYLAGFQEEFVNCLGYEVVHLRGREPALDPDRPVLEQRGYWFAADGYDKPALATQPTSWTPGFHALSDGRLNLDPDLRLIHLHRVDYDHCLHRHQRRRGWDSSEGEAEAGFSTQYRISDEEFEPWFYTEGGFDGGEIFVERIPAQWRALF